MAKKKKREAVDKHMVLPMLTSYFLNLPQEVRDEIYSYIVVVGLKRKRTPALLLVNRQILREVTALLHLQPLVLKPNCPLRSWRLAADPLDYRQYISTPSLRTVKWVKLVLDLNSDMDKTNPGGWLYKTVLILLRIWRRGHSLERFTVQAEYDPALVKGTPPSWDYEGNAVHHLMIKQLAEALVSFGEKVPIEYEGVDLRELVQ